MKWRVATANERSLSTATNGIPRIEFQSIQGIGVLRVYFQSGTDLGGPAPRSGREQCNPAISPSGTTYRQTSLLFKNITDHLIHII
jgi:hypothetical protein